MNEQAIPAEKDLPHAIWMRKDWWDEEPDRFSVQVKNAAGDPERFLVVSGHSTWLTLKQATEVRAYIDACIHNMTTLGSAEPTAREDQPRPRRVSRYPSAPHVR